LNSSDDCFSLGFEDLKHSELFQSSTPLHFLTSFHHSLSLELALNAPDAFKGYMALSTAASSLSYSHLVEVQEVMYKGCACVMANSRKDKV
jgi:hypothetical protein